MAYISCAGACIRCHQIFSFNPMRVPSLRVQGHREPLCEECVEQVNVLRRAKGLDPIVPLPGAYEAAEEGEFFTYDD